MATVRGRWRRSRRMLQRGSLRETASVPRPDSYVLHFLLALAIFAANSAFGQDNIVIVPAQYAYTLVESMQRLLKGQLFSLPVDPR